MAKKMKLNPNDDDFGQEIDENEGDKQSSSGQLTKDEFLKLHKNYATLKQKVADANNPIWDFMKKFEDKGGDKAALKLAEKVAGMEDIKAQALHRTYLQYLEWLGFFAQEDLVDQAQGRDPKTGHKKAA